MTPAFFHQLLFFLWVWPAPPKRPWELRSWTDVWPSGESGWGIVCETPRVLAMSALVT